MGISPAEQQRLLAQFDGFAGTSIQRTIQESQVAWAETLKAVTAAAIEPAVISVSDIFRSAAIEQVADLSAQISAQMRSVLDMPLSGVARVLSDFGEVARRQSDVYAQVTAAARVLEDAARWQSRPDVLASVLGEYRISGAGVPAVMRRRPEPQPAEVQVVSLPAAGDWREALTLALTRGEASPAEVGAFLYSFSAQRRQAGPFPPEWAVIEAVTAIYKEQGHRHGSQEAFVAWLSGSAKGRALGLGVLSLATFKRWLGIYEQHTGEQVRPGRGKKGRRAIVS